MKVTIFVTTTFIGFHFWKHAPREVDYLRSRHRHVFHVRAEKPVSHNDRQIEFIQFKEQLDLVIEQAQLPETVERLNVESWSCEEWGAYLMSRLNLTKCEVSEDGENGAIVEA